MRRCNFNLFSSLFVIGNNELVLILCVCVLCITVSIRFDFETKAATNAKQENKSKKKKIEYANIIVQVHVVSHHMNIAQLLHIRRHINIYVYVYRMRDSEIFVKSTLEQ